MVFIRTVKQSSILELAPCVVQGNRVRNNAQLVVYPIHGRYAPFCGSALVLVLPHTHFLYKSMKTSTLAFHYIVAIACSNDISPVQIYSGI